MKPTDEQNEALSLFADGSNLVVEAGAGTGKTSTLLFMAKEAEAVGRRSNLVAFNRGIIDEASKKFPRSTEVRTVHSLAYRSVMTDGLVGLYGGDARSVAGKLKDRLHNGKRLARRVEVSRLGIDDLSFTTPFGGSRLSAGWLAGHVGQAVQRFCQSDSPTLEKWHFPVIAGIDGAEESDEYGRGPNNKAIASELIGAARKHWDDVLSPDGRLRFTHAHYLKMWQLHAPFVDCDVLFFDEAQDCSPVMRSIVMAQDSHAQLIFVGDSQQSIYGFTGAVNAMAQLNAKNRCFLTQSFRFGDEVADVANQILENIPGAELRLKGNPSKDSRLAASDVPDVLLARTNGYAMAETFQYMDQGVAVAVADSLKKQIVSFAKAAEDLMAGRSTFHRELAPFENWSAVKRFVEEDPAGDELRLLVRLVSEFGPPKIIERMESAVSPGRADVTVMTAHSSKGLEWGRVRVGGDFTTKAPAENVPPPLPESPEELRLAYVAATRAVDQLDVSSSNWMTAMVNDKDVA